MRMLGRLRRAFARLINVGARPADSRDVRLRKQAMVMIATTIAGLAVIWVGTYLVLGRPQAAAMPFIYQLVTVGGLVYLARTGNFALFRASQLAAILLLPFLMQWALGGFVNGSAVMVWAFSAVLAALALDPPRARLVFAGYIGLAILSALLDPFLARAAAPFPDGLRLTFFLLNIGFVSAVAYAALRYFVSEREKAQAEAERLLHNVLPESIADRLRAGEQRIADDHPSVTVLFADVAGFTPLARRAGAQRVVTILDAIFSRFDELAERHGLEKIKTIGDAYMAVAGAPEPLPDHAAHAADMALEMLEACFAVASEVGEPLAVRIGLHSGQAMAGVIGRQKFAYDLWGDAVNVASRMETHGVAGKIHATEAVEAVLRGRYLFEERGTIDVKGLGEMRTFFLLGPAA